MYNIVVKMCVFESKSKRKEENEESINSKVIEYVSFFLK